MKFRDFVKTHPFMSCTVILDFFIVVIVVLIAIIVANNNRDDAILDILVAPAETKIEINGTEYKSGVHRMGLGKATIKMSADGFKSKETEVVFAKDTTVRVYDYLEPLDGNLNYYAKNAGSFDLLKQVGTDDSKKLVDIISIRDILPLTYFKYGGLYGDSKEVTISENPGECNAVFCLLSIGDTSENNIEVARMLREKGYNPDDYEIQYKNN